MRRPGEPFPPGTRVWFRESPDAWAASQRAGFSTGRTVGEGRQTSEGHRTLVAVEGRDEPVEVFTDRLRSSAPRWATGKALPPKPPRPHVRREAVDEQRGEEMTLL